MIRVIKYSTVQRASLILPIFNRSFYFSFVLLTLIVGFNCYDPLAQNYTNYHLIIVDYQKVVLKKAVDTNFCPISKCFRNSEYPVLPSPFATDSKYEISATNEPQNHEKALHKSQKRCQQSYYEVTSYYQVIIFLRGEMCTITLKTCSNFS